MKERSRPLSRRNFLAKTSKLGAAYAASKWAMPNALAQSLGGDSRIAPEPLVDRGFASVRRIGDGVYATISDRTKGMETRCNGGFVVGRDAAMLVEGFQTPDGASFQIEALRMVSPVPIRGALDTHFHFDHSLGNSAYGARDIEIWAHARVPERMMERYPQWQRESLDTFLAPWQKRMAAAQTDAQRRHAQSDIEGVKGMFVPVSQHVLALPNRLLEPAALPLTVDLGGLSVVIETYLGHTNTDLIVRVPERNVVYAGDLVVNSQYPTNIDGYPSPWRSTLAKFAEFDKETIFVPGHGQLCGLEGVALLRDVFDDIAAQAERLHQAGVPAEEATERYVVPDKFGNFRQFSWGFTVGRTIEQLYSEWQGQPGPVLNY